MNQYSGYAAGGFDWLEIWRQMYDAEKAQADSITPPMSEPSADYWAKRAAWFRCLQQREPQPDPFLRRMLSWLRPDDVVLDIGAGTGRYALPLASHVRRVIALEPSPAMRLHLEQQIADAALQNVEVVADPWPCSGIRADVVFSAHVAYAVREIAPFLSAMHTAARRRCVLALMLPYLNHVFSPFWERVHGEPRLPIPSALEALNVLHQLGYHANMELVEAHPLYYQDEHELIHALRERMHLAPDDTRYDGVLWNAVTDLMHRHDDGKYFFVQQLRHIAIISWLPPECP